MAIVKLSFQEMIMSETLVGKSLMIDGNQETITEIQFEPMTRQIIFKTDTGGEYTAFKDRAFDWVLDSDKPRIKPKKRLK